MKFSYFKYRFISKVSPNLPFWAWLPLDVISICPFPLLHLKWKLICPALQQHGQYSLSARLVDWGTQSAQLKATSFVLEVQCFSRGTIAILDEMFLGDITDVPWAGYWVFLTLAQSSPLATSSHCEKQNLTDSTHPSPANSPREAVLVLDDTLQMHRMQPFANDVRENKCVWVIAGGCKILQEARWFWMTHVTYIQNISDDKTIPAFGLFSSQTQTQHLPDACDLLCCNVMSMVKANTYSTSYHPLSALLVSSFNPPNSQWCYEVTVSNIFQFYRWGHRHREIGHLPTVP